MAKLFLFNIYVYVKLRYEISFTCGYFVEAKY